MVYIGAWGVDEVEKKGKMMGEEWGYPREPA